jgi:hypothetical protein
MWIRPAVSVGILGWLLLRTDWEQARSSVTDIRPIWFVAALLLHTIAQVVSSLRWQMLARPLGFDEPLRRYVGFYFLGMYFNLLLPTTVGGDVARAWYLNGGSGRKTAAFLSVLIERGSGLLVLVALAVIAAGVSPVPLPSWVRLTIAAVSLSAVVGLIAMAVLARLVRRSSRAAPSSRWLAKFWRLAADFARAESLFRRLPRLIVATTFLSLLVQSASVAIVWFAGLAMGQDISLIYLAVAVPLVTLLTMLPVSLNGMGIREAGMSLFLAPAGVPAGIAVSLAFLWFAVTTIVSLGGGAVYWFGHFAKPVATDAEPSQPSSRRAA